MSDAPRIHFVVPYYVDPKYLFELIESMRKQTVDTWRLTIVDDQYPGTAARDYIAELDDPRIELIQNEKNLGTIGNASKCMSLGRERYITVMGADDALEPSYVEVVLEAFRKHPDAIMMHPGVVVVDENSQPTDTLADQIKRMVAKPAWKHDELDGPTAARTLMRGNWLYCPSMCFRNEVMGRGETMGRTFLSIGDLAMVLDMLMTFGGTMALEPTPAFRYRRFAGNHSSQHAKSMVRFEEEQRYYTHMVKALREQGWTKASRAARWHPTTRLHAMRAALGAAGARDFKLAGNLTRLATRWVR
jgi:glycosyltransferase involved in cell wall biosynthesis